MRISQRFNLGVNQYSLDFIDIDPSRDTPLYLSPHILSTSGDIWSRNANDRVRSFFQYVINQIGAGNIENARNVFGFLSEPKETCLGQSREGTRGSGIGNEYANEILDKLIQSRAVESGLISDLEDTIIFVDGVGLDRMSDITTNLIRNELIDYTQSQCRIWGLPLVNGLPLGNIWDIDTNSWILRTGEGLLIDEQLKLLVPKSIVTKGNIFSANRFLRLPVASFIQSYYSDRTGRFLTKKEVIDNPERYYQTGHSTHSETTKEFLRRFVLNHPMLFENFKEDAADDEKPVENFEITSNYDYDSVIDYLIQMLGEVERGRDDANIYEKITAGILELIFHPEFICPELQSRIDNGRKIVDIRYTNASKRGIFRRLIEIDRIPCSYIFVECKNYTEDPANPEVDQLLGRFSFQNGEVGLLVCRSVENLTRLIRRCNDIFLRQKKLIIPLTDDDLLDMLESVRKRYDEHDLEMQPYNELMSERISAVRNGI